jgi:6-phosphogluconolactonase (cycloisomerase 2 family)
LTLVDLVAQGVDGVGGLYGVLWGAVSADGRRLYAASTLEHAVAAFERDPRSGMLTFLEEQRGAPDRACLAFARSVAVSPDNRNVYVAGASSNAIVAYRVGEPDAATP